MGKLQEMQKKSEDSGDSGNSEQKNKEKTKSRGVPKGGFNINTTMPKLGWVSIEFKWEQKHGNLKLRNQKHDLSSVISKEIEVLHQRLNHMNLEEIHCDYQPCTTRQQQVSTEEKANQSKDLSESLDQSEREKKRDAR